MITEFKIVNKKSGLCLGAHLPDACRRGCKLNLWSWDAPGRHQTWRFDAAGHLINQASGRLVLGGHAPDVHKRGCVLNLWSIDPANCNGGQHQMWKLQQDGQLVNVASGLVLGGHAPDVHKLGCVLNLWSFDPANCNGGQHQMWDLIPIITTPPVPVMVSKLVCVLVPIAEYHGGSNAVWDNTVTRKVGYTSHQHNGNSSYSSQQIANFAAQAQAEANWNPLGASASGSAASTSNTTVQSHSAFVSALNEVSESYEKVTHWKVSLDLPFYLYQGVSYVHLSNGDIIHMNGSSIVQSSTPLLPQQYVAYDAN